MEINGKNNIYVQYIKIYKKILFFCIAQICSFHYSFLNKKIKIIERLIKHIRKNIFLYHLRTRKLFKQKLLKLPESFIKRTRSYTRNLLCKGLFHYKD
jgi:hypothetical protein